MGIRFRIRGLEIIAATLVLSLAARTVAAQVPEILLQVKQGSIWTDHLSIADTETMYFRWKLATPDSSGLLPTARWQMTLQSPRLVANPYATDGAFVPLPSEINKYLPVRDYAYFQIAPNEIASGSSRSLYVRLQVGAEKYYAVYSRWIPVAFTNRSGPDRRGLR
jgi:hypothetical protein